MTANREGARVRVAAVLLAVVTGVGAGAAAAQEQQPELADVTGRVIDATTGDPLPGVSVVLEGTNFRLETDPGGRFELKRVEVGYYRLRLSHPDYEPRVDDFPVLRDGGFVVAMQPLVAETAGDAMTGIMGILTTRSDGSPLAGAAVRVGSGRRGVLTDEQGNFMIDKLAPGLHEVEFVQIGFATRRDTIRVVPGRITNVQVSLAVDPVNLDPLKVVVERREPALQNAGFYERRKRGFGKFIDREEIEMRAPATITDLFTGLTGVTVEAYGTERRIVLRSGRVSFSAGSCYPRVFVDNIVVHDGGTAPARIDDMVIPDGLAGIEIYPSSTSLPARYSSMSAGCGVILIWTRS